MSHSRFRLAILLAGAAVLVPSCRKSSGPQFRVVASTSLISSVVNAVGGNRVRVTTIAPAGFCPGHFDVPPSAVEATAEARLLLNQGWEAWYDGFAEAITNPRLVRITCRTQGNWMVPPVHAAAVEEIADILQQLDPAGAAQYDSGARHYLKQVDSAATTARRMLSGRELPRVICADKQAPFLAWLGFDVVTVYGRPEEFTAQELTRVASVAVDSAIGLFVDNLQSGPDAGKALARAAGCRHVTLTNFPLDGSYVKALLDNARGLCAALGPPPQTQTPVPEAPSR